MAHARVFQPGDVISYREMCDAEGINTLQRGMNFQLGGTHSVILLSRRPGAPYKDVVRDEGRTLVYEGHDAPRTAGCPNPKSVDQPTTTPGGKLTQNGLFEKAALERGGTPRAEMVRAYEKLHDGIWVFAGTFRLVKSTRVHDGHRSVFRFHLTLAEPSEGSAAKARAVAPDHNRVIPTDVKLAVWKRDHGRCTECGATTNLHFDHIIPFSRGGTSLKAENIQLLCAKHNLAKHDHIV